MSVLLDVVEVLLGVLYLTHRYSATLVSDFTFTRLERESPDPNGKTDSCPLHCRRRGRAGSTGGPPPRRRR